MGRARAQQGWLLLETIVLGLMLLAAVSCLQVYQKSVELRQADGVRTTAVFLAREEYSRLQCRADRAAAAVRPTTYGWLGSPTDLQANGGSYTVEAVVGDGHDGCLPVRVAVGWQTSGHSGTVTFERMIVPHSGRRR